MISKLNHRIWIIFICWYIVIKSFGTLGNLITRISAQDLADRQYDPNDEGGHHHLPEMPNIHNFKVNTAAIESKNAAHNEITQYAHPYKTNKLINKDKLMLVSYTANNLHKLRNNYKKNVVNILNKKLYASNGDDDNGDHDDIRNNLDKQNEYIVHNNKIRFKRSSMKKLYSTHNTELDKILGIGKNGHSVNSSNQNVFTYSETDSDLNTEYNNNSGNVRDYDMNRNDDDDETTSKIGERDLSSPDRNTETEFITDDNSPLALPLRPIIRGPYEEDLKEEMAIVFAEQHSPVKINCEVDLDITTSVWMKDGQIVDTIDRKARNDARIIREARGGLTISNVMLEDDGVWQCEAENFRGYVVNARPIKLIVLDPPKPPYLLIDSRRLDAGNIFVPVKENSELTLACISEGGNPKPILTWEVLLSPGAQKLSTEVLEVKKNKDRIDKDYKINTGAISEAKLPTLLRALHKARILCVMEHPTLKVRQNASILLDVQYTPSFVLTRTPGFGYPVREGIEVSLKCDVDSNPASTPIWQKDDGDPPVPQTGDGYLNFSSVRREHAGWYKCTSRHLNFQYSSIGYYLSVRYDSVDVTSEPLEQEYSSHNPYKGDQMEVELGGAVTLQCPQGSLGCWSHLDPMTARLKGLGVGITAPTGQFSLKDVAYQDAGTYKCIGQSSTNRKKLESLHTVSLAVKGAPTIVARNTTPIAYPGSPLHLTVEFCANPPAYAARWLHGDRVYTPGNQYGIDVLAYGFIDLPTPFCKEARLTYVHMHERVPRLFYFIVSSPGGVAEAIFNVNFTFKNKRNHNNNNNLPNDEDEELMEPEEIQFPIFSSATTTTMMHNKLINININYCCNYIIIGLLTCFTIMFY